jgi:hypothetical protein
VRLDIWLLRNDSVLGTDFLEFGIQGAGECSG